VFTTLRPEHLQQIREIELAMVQQRILRAPGAGKFAFHCTQRVKDFLLEEGTDAKYGARHLKRAIEKHIVFPFVIRELTAPPQPSWLSRTRREPP
jgi:ATP-dependent Clp protease ATP-binding subunit ClpB